MALADLLCTVKNRAVVQVHFQCRLQHQIPKESAHSPVFPELFQLVQSQFQLIVIDEFPAEGASTHEVFFNGYKLKGVL